MSLNSVASPFPVILNHIGGGLNGGKLYIGLPNQDPETFPKSVFWDADGADPADQANGIDVIGGYVWRAGSPAQIYVDGSCSVRVRDRFGVQVYYRALLSDLKSDLADVGGSSLISFQQSGTGAVEENLQVAMRRFVWADQYKTVIDADDTQSIIRALQTGAALILLDARTYQISDEINVTGMQRLVGKGRERTIINQNDLTKNGLVFSLSYAQGCGAEHLTVKGNAPSANAAGSTGVGIKTVNCNDNASFAGIDVAHFDTSFQVVGCYQLLLQDFRFRYFRTAGLHLAPYTGAANTAGAGNRFLLGKISNLDFSGDNSASIGIWIQQASGEFLNTIDVTVCNVGIKTQPTATSYVRYLFMFQVLGDSCLTNNWQIDGAAGITVANDLVQCWSSNSQGDGVSIFGENIDGFYWRGGWMRDCRFNGLSISGGNNIEITATITRNSAATDNLYSGVLVTGAGTGTVRILGSRVGNVLQTVGTSQQKDNILIEASFAATIEVSGCDLNDPGTGGLAINNQSTTAAIDFAGNLPRRSVGTNASDRYGISAHSISTIAAGATVYVGAGGARGGASDSLIIPGRYCAVVGLRVRTTTAPGAGQSYTYTVMKNGVATAMTGSITDAEFAIDIPESVGGFQITDADALSVRVVTSGGAAVGYHNITPIVEP